MNYYRRYSGDYLRDTARLNLTEHGAYTLLLDYYYTSEDPLPVDHGELYLMVRAMRPEDRKAVDKVLSVYFTKHSDGYHQKRVDKEIAVSKSARANGKGGGRPKTEMGTGIETGIETECGTGDGGESGHPPSSILQPPNRQPPTASLQKTQTPLGGKPPDERFEAAWKNYPKRSGNNPKADALKAWTARLRDGVAHEVMEAGLERYRAWCAVTGKIGTETVMQAARFFGVSRPFEQDFDAPSSTPDYSAVYDKLGVPHDAR